MCVSERFYLIRFVGIVILLYNFLEMSGSDGGCLDVCEGYCYKIYI